MYQRALGACLVLCLSVPARAEQTPEQNMAPAAGQARVPDNAALRGRLAARWKAGERGAAIALLAAIADLRRITELEPEHGAAWNNLGWSLILAGQRDQARAALEQAVELDPGGMAPAVNLGHAYLLTGDTDGAYRHYRETLPLIPDRAALDAVLADFDLFVERGWRVTASREARAWMEAAYGDHAESERLNTEGLAAYRAGDYGKARDAFAVSLALRERTLGQAHPEVVAVSLGNLGQVHTALGEHARAKALIERALKIVEAVYGPDHPEVAICVNNLAGVYRALGGLATAKGLYERALGIFEKVYGPDHHNVAMAVNNLAVVSKALGDLATAKGLFERALKIDEAVYGPDYPAVAIRVNNLAVVYRALGDLATVKGLFERALRIDEAVYGPDHPEVATDVNNLASIYRALGDLATAKGLYERALRIDEAVYGPDHPAVAIRVNNLALLYQDLGDLATAKGLFERALRIDEAVYGPDHPKVAIRVNNLASVYQDIGGLATAKEFYERALPIVQLANQPKLSWSVLGNLSGLHAAAERPALAIFYGKQAVNTLQAQRGRLSELEEGLQASFLTSVEGYYKDLSDLLIVRGRLPEAQQVLELLKQQELYDFVRRDADTAAGDAAAYSAFEQEQLGAYQAASARLAAIGRALLELEAIKPFARNPEQQARIDTLRPQLDAAHRVFQAALERIEQAFAAIA